MRPCVLFSVLSLAPAAALACSSSSTTTDTGEPDAHTDARRAADTGGGGTDAGRDARHPDAARGDASGRADAGREHADSSEPDGSAPLEAGRDAGAACDAGCTSSAITHVVLIVQENHTFDNYFGRYCTAATGSAPSCATGPACCEAGPAKDPSGASPVTLDDAANGSFNPDHLQACELGEIDDGKMDKFVTGTACSRPQTFAYAGATTVGTYWQLAGEGALADRYFQPVAGASSSNDMYFARAGFVFLDDTYGPPAKGAACQDEAQMGFAGPTIADLLLGAGATFGVYAGGYAAAVAADPSCAAVPPACPAATTGYPCDYDPADIPFEYYASLRDKPAYMKDLSALSSDLGAGKLPSFAFVKGLGYLSEHPGSGDTISAGQSFVKSVVDEVAASSYAASTLILVTWDESGGYFDHVPPPATSPVDHQPYGARVPLLALGAFAKKNAVSHVTLEHASIVTFLEWNFLGTHTGQLGTRDAVAHNLGSLLDPARTGVAVPE